MFKILIGFFLGMWATKKMVPEIDERIENIKLNTAEILANEQAIEEYVNQMLLELYRKGELEQKIYELTGVRIIVTKALDAGPAGIGQPIITLPAK